MTSRTIERWWPFVLATAVVGAWYWIFCMRFPQPFDGLMGASSTVAAVIIGFLATAKAFILSMTGTPVFEALKKERYMDDLFSYLLHALLSGIALLTISIIGFFVGDAGAHAPIWFSGSWVFLSVLAIALFLRIVQILFAMLKMA